MNISLNYRDFKKLFPHIKDFEFDIATAKKGLEYIRIIQQKDTYEYRYTFKVIDKPLFMIHTIKTGVSPIMVE